MKNYGKQEKTATGFSRDDNKKKLENKRESNDRLKKKQRENDNKKISKTEPGKEKNE